MDKLFWASIVLLFFSALTGALVKMYSHDACLHALHCSRVYVLLKDARYVLGRLHVLSNCLEIAYQDPPMAPGNYRKRTFVVYEDQYVNVELIVRPSPAEGSKEYAAWRLEIERLKKPSLWRQTRRRLRNFFNLLRDAFGQALPMVFGVVKKRTSWVAQLPVDDRVNEVSKNLFSVIPNAYEPILERYLGHPVVLEKLGTPPEEFVGLLQEYTAKFILVREVDFIHVFPKTVSPTTLPPGKYDVIFPRPFNIVRHLADEVS